MYVETVPNRNSRPTYLIREGKRVGKKVVKTTLANITRLPDEVIEQIRVLLRGGAAIECFEDAFSIEDSVPHGHVAAVLGMMRKLHVAELLDAQNSRSRRLALAMIASRVLDPVSKLATSSALHAATAAHTLGEELGLRYVDENDLYETMDWLYARKGAIEKRLAKRHLKDGALVMCDLTSTWVEGEAGELAEHDYSRDRKKQIVFGLLTDAEGCPVAVDVFKGNTADPKAVSPQIQKLQQSFGLKRVVLVGDRGLLTEARLREEVRPAGLDYITGLRKSGIRKIVEQEKVQPGLFDERDLIELRSEQYPGERIVLCRNPVRADKSQRDREALLDKTETALEKIAQATRRKHNPLRKEKAIGLRVGRVLGRWKMRKHFVLDIRENHFSYARDEASIRAEASLDGMYAVRSTLEDPSDTELVAAYKKLSVVEAAFRSLKTVSIKVRPIHHYAVHRVVTHIFLCTLAYYVEYHMKRRLAPMLFAEDDPAGKQARRKSVVQPAPCSPSAEQKARTKKTPKGEPVMSYKALMKHLAKLSRHTIVPLVPMKQTCSFTQVGTQTDIQQRAFELLGVKVK